jgi:phosphoenolpyruvate carboxykinase (ATP)
LAGVLDDAETYTDPVFGLRVPLRVPGVPPEVMRPRDTWRRPEAYDAQARALAERFEQNYARIGGE